jgi:hypothetical protein
VIYLAGARGGCSAQCPHTYSGVRTGDQRSYWRWESAGRPQELYLLGDDPDQLRNRADDPRVSTERDRLERQRRLLRRCAGRSCDVPPFGYLDLPEGGARWRAHAHWADTSGLGAAYADGTFRPHRPVSREELLDWLWRAAGSPDAGATDREGVPDHLRQTIGWAEAEGLVPSDDERFTLGRPVPRLRAVNWLWELAGRPADPTTAHGFVDVAANRASLRWATATGVVRSTQRRFRPSEPTDRASAVAWVHHAATLDRSP